MDLRLAIGRAFRGFFVVGDRDSTCGTAIRFVIDTTFCRARKRYIQHVLNFIADRNRKNITVVFD